MEPLFILPIDYQNSLSTDFTVAELKQIYNLLNEEIERNEKEGFMIQERIFLFDKIRELINDHTV